MRHLAFLSAVFWLSFPAIARTYIVGGQSVRPRDPVRSSTVALYDPSPGGRGGSLCTASLLRKDIAVTAAHCLESGGPSPVLIFGSDVRSPQALHRPVEGYVVNRAWATKQGRGMDQGDIALVKFSGGLPEGYAKVSSWASEKDLKPGTEAILAGYGINNATTRQGAGRLRKTSVRIADARPGKSEMILDQSHGRGACHGDSGGPAFLRRGQKTVLAGVTNRSYPDSAPDDCHHQVVYTKVPAYRSWIRQSERALDAKPVAAPFKHRLRVFRARRGKPPLVRLARVRLGRPR